VAGDLNVTNVSADILIGDADAPATGNSSASRYLAVGDSLAYGYQAALFAATPNPAVFNFGYADLFAAHMGKTLTNDGCPGETTNSLINGFQPNTGPGLCGRSPGFPYTLLHHNYGLGNTQLQDVTSFLDTNATGEISVNVGANDLLVFLSACGFPSPAASTCISNGLAGIQTQIFNNTRTILDTIRAHAPNTDMTVMGLYNPYPTVLSIGGIGADAIVAQINAGIRTLASQHSAHFVDPLPVFNPSGSAGGPESGDIPAICALTGMCPGGTFNPASPLADIHPTKKGYAALASLFESASGL
jgi:lysophospholipase L1-like esterase